MKLDKGDRLLFIGDSITDCGRKQPVGEGLFDPYGRGYVAQVEALLTAVCPELGVRVINMGTSGHTVRDLKERWERDVTAQRPDWLAMMIGINDVWRQFDSPRMPETHVYLDEYKSTLDELIATTRPQVKGLVVLSPYYLEPNRQDPMRAAMDRYGAAARQVAGRHGCLFVDVQAAMDRLLAYLYPGSLAWDRVHPGQGGHMAIARAFLQALDFRWE